MNELWDPTHVDVDSDETVIALVDALAELDTRDGLYPADEADLVEANRRTQIVFDRAELADDEALRTLIAEVTITEVESWLAQAPVEAFRAGTGPQTMATADRTVPELAELGYAAEFEIDADVDVDARCAELSVTVRPVVDDPVGLDVLVIGSDGVERLAAVNRYGLAIAPGISINAARPPKIILRQRGRRSAD